jgi:anti-anti-sigma regulatory factor
VFFASTRFLFRAARPAKQPAQISLVPRHPRLTHEDACRISRLALERAAVRTIVIDQTNVREATTSAFARLVLLRRVLRRTGRDLRLVNLHDHAATLFEVNRLGKVLPRA